MSTHTATFTLVRTILIGFCFVAAPVLAQLPPSNLPDIAERAVKSVVNISSTKRLASSRGPMNDPFFRRFFGRRQPPQPERGRSLGSGVIVDGDGLVLTNSHVVHDSSDIKVTLASGRELSAEIVGSDPKSDVAVLRIKGDVSELQPMPIGNSDTLRLGETVIAIGNPFGLAHTVTMGIVSAKGRAGMGITDYEDFIQTDAAINPGNSGGALVNMKGQLVGINTAIFSKNGGGNQGIGFAIPTEMAVSIKNSLVKTGTVRRGWLGVSIQDLDSRIALRLGAKKSTRGVLVSGVLDNTPADRAGIESGDIIVEVDGHPTTSTASLRTRIAMKGQGSSTEVKYLRAGETREVTVVLGELEENSNHRAPVKNKSKTKTDRIRGLEVGELNARARRELELDANVTGVLVIGVDPGSAAAKARIRRGDVIVAVEKRAISSVRALGRALKAQRGEALIRIRRGSSSVFVILGDT